MHLPKLAVAMTWLLVLAYTTSQAQENLDSLRSTSRLDSVFNAVDARFHRLNEDSALKSVYAFSKEDSTIKKALTEYQVFGLEHRRKTLQWNLTSSRIIFWSVIILVFTGIVFAGLQFYISLYPTKRNPEQPVANLVTELEANLKGIKVNSPVLGVIILIISLLFFYLYLVYVYPITEIF